MPDIARSPSKALLLAAALAVGWVHGAHAETAEPGELDALQRQIETSLEKQKALEAQSEAARREAEEIRNALIESAANVQRREADVSASEDRLQGLRAAEADLTVQLERRRAAMAELLAALTSLDRQPPPALAVRPDDALASARSAMLLGAAVPELQAEAAELRLRLEELARLREEILAERQTLGESKTLLESERLSLEALLARKLEQQAKLSAAFESEQARAERLSRQATDLTDLIARLEAGAAARLPMHRPDERPEPAREAPPPASADTAETRMAVLRPPSGPPAMPSSRLFSDARGLIRPPAAGRIVQRYGAPDGLGGQTQGLTIETRADAHIIAPFDGRISYAGPFRRYGQLLIISVGEGYHVLLAGMTRIDGAVGQSVLAGEPVGTMGSSPSGDDLAVRNDKTGRDGIPGRGPELYIEIRKDGSPIDPRPWLTMSDKKASG
ncbi:MAG: peptidoglycan DD-metalloendopeptidase family protein [Parvibaculum sp.]|nr:peptidoglycan DD-metalloendopeptidase family protein [Parvibaculum sp.]